MKFTKLGLIVPVAVLGVAGLVAPVGATPRSPAAGAACGYSFETGFEGWVPNSDGLAKAWTIDRDTKQASDGIYSLLYWTDGSFDDGTVWVEQQFKVLPFQTVNVDLSFDLWADAPGRNGWPVVAYAGAREPKAEIDFTIIGEDLDHEGWKTYGHTDKVTADESGEVWVAFGVSVTWETPRTHSVDCANLTVA